MFPLVNSTGTGTTKLHHARTMMHTATTLMATSIFTAIRPQGSCCLGAWVVTLIKPLLESLRWVMTIIHAGNDHKLF